MSFITSRKPIVYFAGKIAPHDWREEIVGTDIQLDIGDTNILFDPHYAIEHSDFYYAGPFYVRCDHRCAHGPAEHGVGAIGDNACLSGMYIKPRRVLDVNRRRLANADLVFVYINQLDCFGTLMEIGMAAEMGKRIALVLDDKIARVGVRELWMARLCANGGTFVSWPVAKAWREALRLYYAKLPAPQLAAPVSEWVQ